MNHLFLFEFKFYYSKVEGTQSSFSLEGKFSSDMTSFSNILLEKSTISWVTFFSSSMIEFQGHDDKRQGDGISDPDDDGKVTNLM